VTNDEAVEILRGVKSFLGRDCLPKETPQAIDMAIAALNAQTTVAIYDQEEIHHNCIVQVLRNSVTGDVSVGWWREKEEEE
jgi:hypothetical protein